VFEKPQEAEMRVFVRLVRRGAERSACTRHLSLSKSLGTCESLCAAVLDVIA
jgi:hypothetical protein